MLYAAGLGNPFSQLGGVFQSRDGGASWTSFLAAKVSFRTVVDPTNARHVLVFTRGRFNTLVPYVTRDGGATWKALPEVDFDDVTFDPSKSQNVYAAGTNALYFSRDGRDSWTRSTGGNFQTKPALDPANPKLIYAASNAGVLKSTNAGEFWVLITQLNFRKVIAHPTKSGFLNGISNGMLYTSSNQGVNWNRTQMHFSRPWSSKAPIAE